MTKTETTVELTTDQTAALLNEEWLAEAMVVAFRRVAREHWPFLRGSGWPAYHEHGNSAQVLVVSEIAEAVSREYDRLYFLDAEAGHPAAPWNRGDE